MAREEIIRDFYGRIIGKYEHQANGDIVVRDFYNRILGYYIASRDVTTDFYRRTVAKGNAVCFLRGNLRCVLTFKAILQNM